jgi:hypothetical protein
VAESEIEIEKEDHRGVNVQKERNVKKERNVQSDGVVGKKWNDATCSVSRWRPQKVDKRMVLVYTHG